MSFKVYTKGNYFYIIDNDTNREYNALSKDVLITRGTTTQDDFYIENVSNWKGVENPLDITEMQDMNGSAYSLNSFITFYETNTGVLSSTSAADAGSNLVSVSNSTTTLLTNGSVFTGEWEDVSDYNSAVVAIKTDQNGTFSVQFSPDGTNQDSTLTRYYRTDHIEAPHRFTITRSYARVVFTNDSGSDQTYLRLQTTFGTKADLNAPLDSTLAQDFDAIAVRGSDYHSEVALGLRQGVSTVNKFGYNLNVDTGSESLVAAFGGAFDPTTDIMTVAQTFEITYSVLDGLGTTGALGLIIEYLDGDFNLQTGFHTLGSDGTDTTSFTGLGINRASVFSNGGAGFNRAVITIKATTDTTPQAEIPPQASVTQQCIYHTPISHNLLLEWIYFNPSGASGGFFNDSAKLNIKVYSWSRVTETRYDIANLFLDVSVQDSIDLRPPSPFIIGGREVLYASVSTDTNDSEVSGRLTGELHRNKDA